MKTVIVPTLWIDNPAYDAHFIGAFNLAGIPLQIDGERQLDWHNLRTVEPGPLVAERLGLETKYTHTPTAELQSYTEGWDKGFAGEGDPYGISEYTAQSANPDAFVPTQEEADRIVAEAQAEKHHEG
jgi:hypothetical protein